MATLKKIVPSEMNPPLNPVLVTDEAGLSQVEAYLQGVTVASLDIETNCTDDFTQRRIRTIQIGDRNVQYVIDLLAFAGSEEALIASQGWYGTAATEMVYASLLRVLRPFLDGNRVLKVGYGLQFEYETFKFCLGIRSWHFYDLFLAEKRLFAGLIHFMAKGFWGLEDLVARYTGLEMSKDEQKGFDLKTPLREEQIIYGALDVRLPMSIFGAQSRKLTAERLDVVSQIEFDAIPAFGDLHLNGILLSKEAWLAIYHDMLDKQRLIVTKLDEHFMPVCGSKHVTPEDIAHRDLLENMWRECPNKTPEQKTERAALRQKFMAARREINEREKKIADCEGEAFINYGSTKQLKDAMWKLGFKKSQLPDTNDATLEKLASDAYRTWDVPKHFEKDPTLNQYSLVDLIRLYRSTNKSLTTYGVAWVNDWNTEDGLVHPTTGRIHSNINQFGAATGRTSSSSPNIQNIPRGSAYRSAFCARSGFKFITVDMSGAELRILAEMSREPVWVEAFAKGWDVHSVCAEILFGATWKDAAEDGCKFYATKHKCSCKEHKKLRDIAKTLNFGLAYGMGPKRLAESTGISKEDAIAVFESFKNSFPVVFQFLEDLGNYAKANMEVRDLAGGRRSWTRPNWASAEKKALEDCKKGEKPSSDDIRRKLKGMVGGIEREGKNAPIQGLNAVLMKLAMGCGFDADGNPYLWHTLEPKFGAFTVNMVHDELCTESPEDKAEDVLKEVGSAMVRASARFMKLVAMDWEGHVDTKWSK